MKSKIAICIPVYHQDERVKNSLTSIAKEVQRSKHDIYIAIGINGASNELKNWIFETFKETPKSYIEVFDTNLGKGKAVNELYKICKVKGGGMDFIFSVDSDLVFPHPIACFIDQMVSSYQEANHNLSYVLAGVSAQQNGVCCHLQEGFSKITLNEWVFRKYDRNTGIAGGALLIYAPIWDTIGGYRAFNLYGSDDGHFMLDSHNKGYVVLMNESLAVYHPEEKDQGYIDWKVKSARNELENPQEGYIFA